MNLKILNCKLF